MNDLPKRYYVKFGENLQRLLEKHSVDVVTVASVGNIEQKQVYRALRGEHGPSMKTILAIARGLNVAPKELFDFEFEFDYRS